MATRPDNPPTNHLSTTTTEPHSNKINDALKRPPSREEVLGMYFEIKEKLLDLWAAIHTISTALSEAGIEVDEDL